MFFAVPQRELRFYEERGLLPPLQRTATASASADSHVVTDRLAAIDAEIERLTRLRGRLVQRTGRV
ncbi:hypothetical protein [Streptomyces sp. NPDC007883]|uniref:hypothetical protein n=1 Tax=Streptomyces sp. NPDC007883 TaxID=3155116 RepID=UPI0033E31AEF